MCKKTGYEFYCKECFVVKQKSKYSCESVICFNLGLDIIKKNCKFAYYFNKTDIFPTVLDRGNKIILANWPDEKHILCNVTNDIPIKIPSHLYVLVNRSVLCNCGIEAENNFLLESLAACHGAESKLEMYYMVNTAFVNYIDNLTEFLKFPILLEEQFMKRPYLFHFNLSKLILTY